MFDIRSFSLGAAAIALAVVHPQAVAARPTPDDVNVYSSLCSTGQASGYGVNATVRLPLMELVTRRLLKGEIRLSASALTDQFPGIADEKNLLQAMQTYQNCVYRYVELFHGAADPAGSKPNPPSNSVVAPSVPLERRREIVYLVSQLEDFKSKMRNVIAGLPETYYDKTKAREVRPRQDMRILGSEGYGRYRAFQGPDGILDFSNASNNDLSIMCETFFDEATEYGRYFREYRKVFDLQAYSVPRESARICRAAKAWRS